jgi:hypothetical protein
MWPDVVGPDELKLLERVIARASTELRIEAGSEEHENLASLVLALFQTVKEPDDLLAVALRGSRLGGVNRSRPDPRQVEPN